MNIKLIVTDLDRTLLRTDKTISSYTASILRTCQERGVLVAFATARSENSCKRYVDLIKPNAVISNGGALTRIGEQTIYRATMNAEITSAIMRSCLAHTNGNYITVDTDKGYFVNKPIGENHLNWQDFLPATYIDFSLGLNCDAYKITTEIFDKVAAHTIVVPFPTVSVMEFSGEGWFRFADNTADKWNGVVALASHLKIDFENIAAFGDDYNDVEMLCKCGVGVAVDNAINEAKSNANFICESNDNDGAAKWLEHNILRESNYD